MAIFSIESIRDFRDWRAFFGQRKVKKATAESADVTSLVAIHRLDELARTSDVTLLPRGQKPTEDPSQGLGKWGEVEHLDIQAILSNPNMYHEHVKNSYERLVSDSSAKTKPSA